MRTITIALCACLLVAAGVSSGEAAGKTKLTVAVLDFDSDEKGGLTLGAKVATLLEVGLNPGGEYELVERSNVKKILEENGLGMTGLLDTNSAARVGNLLGAKVLVTGRVFSVDDEMFLAAKVISVETGRVYGEAVSIDKSQKLGPGVARLSRKVNNTITQNAAMLVAVVREPVDTIETVSKALGDSKRPTVAVTGVERHVGQAVVDPAATTELKHILLKTNFEVYDDHPELLSNWAKEYFKDSSVPTPSGRAKADVLIVAEAVSEFAARTEGLISCRARVEVRAIDRRTGRLLAIGRKTVTEVGLSEQIAAKSAIQKATADIAAALLPDAVKKWNEGREN